MKTLSVKLPPSLNAKLNLAARRQSTSNSDVIRKAVENYLSSTPSIAKGSVLDLAGDLIGCLDGGPDDLAHNKKHMKGYGR